MQVTKIEQELVDIDRDSGKAELRFKIYIENVGDGTIVDGLDECFQYREPGYRETLKLSISGAYRPECPEDVRLSRDTKEDVITCKVYDIDRNNLGPDPSEIVITLSGFAYEDEIEPVEISIEPS